MVTRYCNLLYICNMKRRIITFGRYFGEFMEGLTAKEREKVDYGLVLLKTPSSEITKALMIKERYYEYKRANDSGL